MKYAFIDYENVNTLDIDGINLCEYARIFLFVGAADNQNYVMLPSNIDNMLNISLIKVHKIAKNNLDFHIAYFLGRLDVTVNKDVEFHVLSYDRGYEGLCEFISSQPNGRRCRLLLARQLANIQPLLENKGQEGEATQAEAVSKPSISISVPMDKSCQEFFHKYRNIIKKTKDKSHLPTNRQALRNHIIATTGMKYLQGHKAEEYTQAIMKYLGALKALSFDGEEVIWDLGQHYEAVDRYQTFKTGLLSRKVVRRPKTKKALTNEIRSLVQNNEKQTLFILQQLKNDQIIENLTEGEVKYLR